MSWIKQYEYEEADEKLKKIYDRVAGPENNIDNVLKVHSLRPHSLVGHMTLYKNVLHNSGNTLPKWYLEALGVYVSYLNRCGYCVDHHFAGLSRLLDDEAKSKAIMKAIETDDFEGVLEDNYAAGMYYAELLTNSVDYIREKHVEALRSSGFSDGEILEINQVVSYFNYANRTVLGLGVNTEGDILGLSPNESADPMNWNHS